MKYEVTLIKTFSTVVEVEADSIEEAKNLSYELEPNDSIVGFDWEPNGEGEIYVIYNERGENVWPS